MLSLPFVWPSERVGKADLLAVLPFRSSSTKSTMSCPFLRQFINLLPMGPKPKIDLHPVTVFVRITVWIAYNSTSYLRNTTPRLVTMLVVRNVRCSV